jgi:hypothetical protein
MRLNLPPLSNVESRFILKILNAPEEVKAGRKPIEIAEELDREFVRQQKRMSRGKLWGAIETDEKKTRDIVAQWTSARNTLGYVFERRDPEGFFLFLPPIGLPSKLAMIMLRKPDDLADWFVARAVANRQNRRFVKCARCGRFGLRRRARKSSQYCSEKCQREENRQQIKNRASQPREFVPVRSPGRD